MEAAFRPKGSGNSAFVLKKAVQDLILAPFLPIVGPVFGALERAASCRHWRLSQVDPYAAALLRPNAGSDEAHAGQAIRYWRAPIGWSGVIVSAS
jgi:hypothetical protein